MSKREKHLHFCRVVISVTDKNTFRIKCLPLLAKVQITRSIRKFHRESLRQFSGRIYFSIEDIGDGTGTFLSRKIGHQNCLDLRDPGHFHRRSGIENNADITVSLDDFLDQTLMGLRKFHMLSVERLGFKTIRKTGKDNDHILGLGRFDSSIQKLFIDLIFFQRIARLINEILTGCRETGEGIRHMSRMDMGTSAALETGLLGHGT